MAYNEKVVNRVREALAHLAEVEEKTMFQGLTFMVDGKMCVGIRGEEIMCRIDPAVTGEALERNGARPMIHNGRTMKGFVFIAPEGYQRREDFDYWVGLALDFNKRAKASKKRKKT